MNKEATQELMMGAVLVLLAYAAYRHFTANSAPPTAGAPTAPRQGLASSLLPTAKRPTTQTPMPSPYTSLTDLLSGTTHDIGAYEGRNYLDEISYVRGAGTGIQTTDALRMPRVGELSTL